MLLRPTFTTYILKRLLNGESINIYGDVNVDEYSCAGIGVGKSRLIEDLASLVEDDITVISLDMKNYVFGDAFEKFLKDISLLLGDRIFDSFGAFIEGTAEKKVMLLIDNFHYFFDNNKKDARFDEHFIDNLNSAHNKAHISILVTTHKPHKHYSLYIGEIKKYRASWLEFTDIEISELTYQELKDEVDRVFPSLSEHKRVEIVGNLNGELSMAIVDKFQQQLESGQRLDDLSGLVKEVKTNCNKQYNKQSYWLERWFKLWKEIKAIMPFVKVG
jgi:hypothetical protein